MSKKYNALAVLSIIASVGTVTAIVVTTAVTKTQQPTNTANNIEAQDELEIQNQIISLDLKAFKDKSEPSQAQKDQFKADVQTAKQIHTKYSSMNESLSQNQKEQLTQLEQNIILLESKLVEKPQDNNSANELQLQLDALKSDIDAQSKLLTTSTESSHYLDVFNESEKILVKRVTELSNQISSSNNEELKANFDSLIVKNNANKSNAFAKIKEKIKPQLDTLILISQEYKNLISTDINNANLPEAVFKLVADAVDLNNTKQAIQNDITSNELLNSKEKTDFSSQLISSNTSENIGALEQLVHDKVAQKASAINKVVNMDLFGYETQRNFIAQIIEQGPIFLTETVDPIYQAKLNTIKELRKLEFLTDGAYSSIERDLIMYRDNMDVYSEVLENAKLLNDSVKEAKKEVESLTNISQISKDEHIKNILYAIDVWKVDEILSRFVGSDKNKSNEIEQLKSSLLQAHVNEQIRNSITELAKHSSIDANLNHFVLGNVESKYNDINGANESVLTQQQKEALLSKLANVITNDDLLGVEFDFKTEKEKNEAKTRVDQNQSLASNKDEIKRNIDAAQNYYDVKIAEWNNSQNHDLEIKRARVQSEISKLEYISQKYKNEINKFLDAQNTEDVFNAKKDELVNLNESKKQSWAQLNISESNFNKYFFQLKKFEFNDAKTNNDANAVISFISELNTKVTDAIAEISNLQVISDTLKNNFKTAILNVNRIESVAYFLEDLRKIHTSFEGFFNNASQSEHLTQEQKDAFVSQINNANSLYEGDAVGEKISIAIKISKIRQLILSSGELIDKDKNTLFNELIQSTITLDHADNVYKLITTYIQSLQNKNREKTSIDNLKYSSEKLAQKYKTSIDLFVSVESPDLERNYVTSKQRLDEQKTNLVNKLNALEHLSQENKNMFIAKIKDIDSETHLNSISAYIDEFNAKKQEYKALIDNTNEISQEQKDAFKQKLEAITQLHEFVKLGREIKIS
ncbi:GA module-containing protein [Mycoplasma simbae]|uniref:GA module-containing protein n=1 Tax=Mycoplasma simbae TaxID=36744 RepID=UPI000497B192|nr:GA module-containing protein [Mycoplasma simbae]